MAASLIDVRLDALPTDPAALQAIVRAQAARLEERDCELGKRDRRLAVRDNLIDKLRAQLAASKRARFGASSEKIERAIAQLELAPEEAEASQAEVVGDHDDDAQIASPLAKPYRKPLPDHLPRDEVRHEAPRACPSRGGHRLTPAGEDVTEVLDYVPASFRVRRHVRPRYACRDCEARVQAPTVSLPIERGRPGAGLLAHVLIAKYADRLPLYRQLAIYGREGVDLPRSTLADWVGRSASLMAPLIEALRDHVMAAAYLHGDDTPVPVLESGRGRTRQGRLWAYLRDGRPWAEKAPPAVWYAYSPDRKGRHVEEHLADFNGVRHADGYAGFERLYEPAALSGTPWIVEAACWAHVLRKFFDLTTNGPAPIAEEALERIGKLYDVEATIQGRPPDERRAARQAKAAPMVEALKDWLEAEHACLPGKSATVRAIRYALSRWTSLARYLEDGRIAIDTDVVEKPLFATVYASARLYRSGVQASAIRA